MPDPIETIGGNGVADDRLLIVFVHGSADLYGSDKVLLFLATSLVMDTRFEPLVVLDEDGPLRACLEAEGVEVHVASVVKISRSMFNVAGVAGLYSRTADACRAIDRILGTRSVALVHSNTLAVLGGAWWALRRGHVHVWHVHEIIRKPLLMRRLLPWLAGATSSWVIANSGQTRAWLCSVTPRLSAKSSVIFNGLPPVPPVVTAKVETFRKLVAVRPDDVLVTVAGRLNAWKGQGLALAAFGLLKRQKRLGRLRLVLVGSCVAGQEHIREALQRQVVELELGAEVSIIDFVDDIYTVWRASDIALVPSIEPEPFGMVAIEAMACGLPVVAAGHGGLLDIVVDGATGLLFPPRDSRALAEALWNLEGDAGLRNRLGRAGRARQLDEFSLQRQMASTCAIYSRLAVRQQPATA